jgi:NDP-sugar pyrophosphorylase family protein
LQIVILAGGRATRLYPITKTIPKSMVEIQGKPFFKYQLELLKKNKIYDIVMCVGTFADQIIEYFGDGKDFGVSIKYSIEKPEKLLGTAGAIKNAERLLDESFFVMYGDSYLPVDFAKISNEFSKRHKAGLMTVYENDGKFDKSNVAISNGIVTIYDKSGKFKDLRYIDYGLLVLEKKTIDSISSNEFVNLESILGKMIEKKELAAYEVNQRFYEIGSMSGIKDFEKYLDAQ